MAFDERNTKDWQQDGNGVFLLREIPGKWEGKGPDRRHATEDEFSVMVHHADRDHLAVVMIARRIAEALNGLKWQDEKPTPGDWWVAIHPKARKLSLSDQWVRPVTVSHSVISMNGFLFARDHEIFQGARWLKRETPVDPFADRAYIASLGGA
jgi:hypothetical protein